MEFATGVLTVNKQFDWAVSVFFKWVHELLIECVLIKLVQNDFGDLGLLNRVLAEVGLQVVKLVAISLDKDQVKSFVNQKVCVRTTHFGASPVNYSRVLLLSALIIL